MAEISVSTGWGFGCDAGHGGVYDSPAERDAAASGHDSCGSVGTWKQTTARW